MADKIVKAVKKTAKKAEARVHETKEKIAAAKNPTTSKVNSNKLELLVTIVPSPKAEFYTDLLSSYEVNFQFTSCGYVVDKRLFRPVQNRDIQRDKTRESARSTRYARQEIRDDKKGQGYCLYSAVFKRNRRCDVRIFEQQ